MLVLCLRIGLANIQSRQILLGADLQRLSSPALFPAEDKQLLKEQLGFTGYKVGELNPTLTRRATAVSWLLSYMRQHSADA